LWLLFSQLRVTQIYAATFFKEIKSQLFEKPTKCLVADAVLQIDEQMR
jgi:hypothetical protein